VEVTWGLCVVCEVGGGEGGVGGGAGAAGREASIRGGAHRGGGGSTAGTAGAAHARVLPGTVLPAPCGHCNKRARTTARM
jgi:hypothetical protein